LGLLLISSPWFLGDTHVGFDMSPTLSIVVGGALVAICSALQVSLPLRSVGLSGANVAFGFWTLTSPWVFGYNFDTVHTSFSAIIGASIILVGMWSGHATLRVPLV
jgi:hypothetical protein